MSKRALRYANIEDARSHGLRILPTDQDRAVTVPPIAASGGKPAKPRAPRIPEHVEAVNLMRWVRSMTGTYPSLRRFHAIPNGGHRSKATAGKLKAEGAMPGVLDYFLPCARGRWHGLYLELKAQDGRPSPEQTEFARDVIAEGFAAVFCKGWQDASRALVEYLRGAE